jgi:rare lipoprotein A
VRWLTLILLLCPTIAHACATATVYAARYDGRTTASGAVYRHAGISAASPWLKIGTRVVVTHGDRTLAVTITDTMPLRKGCVVLDLSGGAARRLGLRGMGRIEMRVKS